MQISQSSQILADFYQKKFDMGCSFSRMKDQDSTHTVDVLTAESQLGEGINTYISIGLSDYDIPAEFIMIADNKFTFLNQLLATTVFSLLREKWNLVIGSIIPDITSLYTEGELDHLLLMPPFLWDESLENIAIEDKNIFTYFLVPISDSEREFAEEYGVDKLIELLNIYDIDISDLERKSIEIPALF